jgi:hypothetical protein
VSEGWLWKTEISGIGTVHLLDRETVIIVIILLVCQLHLIPEIVNFTTVKKV